MALGDFAAAAEKVAFEKAVHEIERDDLVPHAEEGAMLRRKGNLAMVVFRPVIEAEPGDDLVLARGGVQGGDGVHASADEDDDFHFEKF